MMKSAKRIGVGLAIAAALLVAAGPVMGQATVLGVHFKADKPFPQYHRLWHEDSNDPDAPEGGPGLEATAKEPLGASIHVLLRNTGAGPLQIEDVEYAGESLKNCLTYSGQRKVRKFTSIYFANLPPDRLQRLIAAGEPIWMKADPAVIPPGGTGQVAVRIRRIPGGKSIPLLFKHAGGTIAATVPVDIRQPRLAGASFGAGLREVYLYFEHTDKGKAPAKVLMDGQDVTAAVTMGRDAGMHVVPAVLKLNRPLVRGSFHVFQGIYDDGRTALAGLRAWHDEFGYGIWGGPSGKADDEAVARNHILDLAAHNINLQVASIGSPVVQKFLRGPAGHAFAAANGLRFVPDEPEKWGVKNPYMMFIHDEPDCADYKMDGVTETKKIGGLAQWCIQQANDIRKGEPDELSMLNVDNTYKPQNWYIYGQLADVLSIDPYYQVRLRGAVWKHPERLPLYAKADYVYAASDVAESSCEPNPLHVILYACSVIDGKNERVFPFPTPECKRIEAYYALGAGAKGLSYWWFTPALRSGKGKAEVSNGVGAGPMLGDPGAGALWREIGLLGAEIRTLGPVVMESCPAEVEARATKGLWMRSLLAGLDTMVLLVVTDQYANSENATTYQPIEQAGVDVKLPTWVKSPQVFEVSAYGTKEIKSQLANQQLHIDLGKVALTRAVVITADPKLRGELQSRFDGLFKAKVARLEAWKPIAGAGGRESSKRGR